MADTNGCIQPVLNVEDWQYRAEGASSLVLYNTKSRMVLRIKKKKCNPCTVRTAVYKENGQKELMQAFIRTVAVPLLGVEYVSVPKVIPVDKDFLKMVLHHFQKQRPAKRQQMEIDVHNAHILSFPDLCFLPSVQLPGNSSEAPTFSVEIKPKRGFLPAFHHLPPSAAVKPALCRFCLYQYYKVRRGVWEEKSRYCPLDLFSCVPSRMKYCLNKLLENPQNNLRIFKNGVTIYEVKEKAVPSLGDQEDLRRHLNMNFVGIGSGEETVAKPLQSSCVQSFLDVIVETLLSYNTPSGATPSGATPSSAAPSSATPGGATPGSATPSGATPGSATPSGATPGGVSRGQVQSETCAESGYSDNYTDKSMSIASKQRHPNCILKRLLAAQTLSLLESDVILPLYRRVLNHLDTHPEDSGKYSLDFPYREDFSVPSGILRDLERNVVDVERVCIEDAVTMIQRFLIARTMHDCSIMVAVQPIIGTHEGVPACTPLRTPRGRSYRWSANVIDLDPKPSSRIPSYDELDRKVIQEYVAGRSLGST